MCGVTSPLVMFFFFKQKTAYEVRISDWSSDVCSSDLVASSGVSGVRKWKFSSHKDTKMSRQAVTFSFAPLRHCNSGREFRGQYTKLIREEIGRASCRERVCQYV